MHQFIISLNPTNFHISFVYLFEVSVFESENIKCDISEICDKVKFVVKLHVWYFSVTIFPINHRIRVKDVHPAILVKRYVLRGMCVFLLRNLLPFPLKLPFHVFKANHYCCCYRRCYGMLVSLMFVRIKNLVSWNKLLNVWFKTRNLVFSLESSLPI